MSARATGEVSLFGQRILVYVDELAALRSDGSLYGNVYVKRNAEGVYERINPTTVQISTEAAEG